MGVFDNALNESLVDYSSNFEKRDKDLVKKQIKEWIDEHCSFVANVESVNKTSEDNADYEVTDDLIINVFNNINVRSDENLPSYIKFGKVDGSFFVVGSNLNTTDGFPDEIHDCLWMYDTAIEKITDFPTYIKKNCSLRHNKLKSLDGICTKIGGNLDIADNDENFSYTRKDGKIIEVGISFYGSMSNEIKEKYSTTEKKYISMAGDKDVVNAAFAKYLTETNAPIKISTESKNGRYWHTKGDI